MSIEDIMRDMAPRAREELLANPQLRAKVKAIYNDHADWSGKSSREVRQLPPKPGNRIGPR